jgi:hypothetical protein
VASKEFSESFKHYFKNEHIEGAWEMDYMEELDEDLASTLSTAMAKVVWDHGATPLWSFASMQPDESKYKPLIFNERGSTPDFPVAIEFNGIELCPRLVGPDQYDKMAGLFGSHIMLEDELKESFKFEWGVDLGECTQLALRAISADKKAGFALYGIPKPMQSLSSGPEVVLYFYGLLSKALGYAFFEYGLKGLMENHMGFYDDCETLWRWFTEETSKFTPLE